MSDLTIAIMAGGQSLRMGTDKAFVPLLGRPLIEHVLARVADLGQTKTIISTNQPDAYAYLGLPMVADAIPGKGPLGGIYSAIQHNCTEYTLALACDMPFVSPALLRHMIGLCDGKIDVIVPRIDGYPQGLHAIYSQRCRPHIKKRLAGDRLKVIGFYPDVNVRYLDELEYRPFDSDGLAFYNINTPEELGEASRQTENNTIERKQI